MPLLSSRAPRPALADHPEFPLMLAATLGRFHCTLGEIREDYWQGRIWRALSEDPELEGRVARYGVSTVLLFGRDAGAPPASARERDRFERYVRCRITADTKRLPEGWGLTLCWAEGPAAIQTMTARSLLAQTVTGDSRWMNLEDYKADLSPILMPACSMEGVIAA
jgi:hypothetical protein